MSSPVGLVESLEIGGSGIVQRAISILKTIIHNDHSPWLTSTAHFLGHFHSGLLWNLMEQVCGKDLQNISRVRN